MEKSLDFEQAGTEAGWMLRNMKKLGGKKMNVWIISLSVCGVKLQLIHGNLDLFHGLF